MKGARLRIVVPLVVLLLLSGCGYHTGGQAVRLPSDLQTIYVPAFANNTSFYAVGKAVSAAVVSELRSRTNYRILLANDGSADATLHGAITSASVSPLTYDSRTGRVSSAMVSVGMKASLVTRNGKVLWENPNFQYRDQYQVSRDVASFFEEEEPAMTRVAHDFSRTLVSAILEAY